MQELKNFLIEFLAVVALVFVVVALQKLFELYFKRKMGD